jgi:hypothetical protein
MLSRLLKRVHTLILAQFTNFFWPIFYFDCTTTCAVKIHSWANCLARRFIAQQVTLVCGGLLLRANCSENIAAQKTTCQRPLQVALSNLVAANIVTGAVVTILQSCSQKNIQFDCKIKIETNLFSSYTKGQRCLNSRMINSLLINHVALLKPLLPRPQCWACVMVN